MWTRFMDMHSGGGSKEPYDYIYIAAPIEVAKSVFYSRFNHNPDRVSCTCCGQDYSVSEHRSLEQATGYERNCECNTKGYIEEPRKNWPGDYQTLKQFLKNSKIKVKVIYAKEIEEDEKHLDVPKQGYIWRD